MKKYLVTSGLAASGVLLSGFFLTTNGATFTRSTLMAGTLLLYLIYLLSYFLVQRKMKQNNSFQFVNAVSLATFMKLFLCIALVLCYLLMFRKEAHKADIFYLMGVYIVFAVVETAALMRK